MTPAKRMFDVVVAVALLVPLTPLMGVIALLIWLLDGRPVLYVSERMCSPSQGFALLKFRTMRPTIEDSGVSGGDKSDRITQTGRLLRRTRLDELPQLFNVLWGHISFVGPRPPLRQYVRDFPELYGLVLRSRPGITGLASLYFHAHEEWLLSRCRSREETDLVYRKACVPRKATLDLIYQRNANLCWDIILMLKTVAKVFKR